MFCHVRQELKSIPKINYINNVGDWNPFVKEFIFDKD